MRETAEFSILQQPGAAWVATRLHSGAKSLNAALAVVWISSLYFPADSIGAWGRILAGGYALGAAAAIVLCVTALVLRRHIPWAIATGLVALGCLGAVCIYGVSAWALEGRLLEEHHRLAKMLGCVDVSIANNRDFIVCSASTNVDGQLSLRDQPVSLPPNVEQAFRAAEDVYQDRELISLDVDGKVRAIMHPNSSGGSGVCEQYARILLGVPHLRRGIGRYIGKIKVIAGCIVLDGVLSREEQIAAYGSVTDFGSVGNITIQGAPTAARVLFNKDIAILTPTEAFTLASLVRAPGIYFPIARPGEPAEAADGRKERLRSHLQNVVKNAVRHGLLKQADGEEILCTFGETLVSPEQLLQQLPPSIRLLGDAINDQVPDRAQRFLSINSAYDPTIQAMAEKGVASGLDAVKRRLPNELRSQVKADVAILDLHGRIVASVNLSGIPSDVGSAHKPNLFAFALEERYLGSMTSLVAGMSADRALAESNRVAAHALVAEVTPHSYANLLALEGFKVENPAISETRGFNSVADGSGISASPEVLAASMRMFSNVEPGQYVLPTVLPEIRDAITGETIARVVPRRVFPAWAAREVGNALLLTPKIGTARAALGDLARAHPLAAKSGTPHFKAKDGRIRGAGGAWCATFDDQNVVVVRTSLQTTEIPLDGGVAGCLVARDVLENIYSIGKTTLRRQP